MNKTQKLLSASLLLGLTAACNGDAPDAASDEGAASTRSTVLSSGEQQFRVDVTYGSEVPAEQIDTLLETMVILPRAEAFPNLDAATIEALLAATREAQPIDADLVDADGIEVVLQPLADGVLASDFAWRGELPAASDVTLAEPRVLAEPAGELGTVSQAIRADAVLSPGQSRTTGSVSCFAVNLSWLLLAGSGTVTLENRSTGTSERKRADAFPPTMNAVSLPFRSSYRAVYRAGNSGLSVRGELTCI